LKGEKKNLKNSSLQNHTFQRGSVLSLGSKTKVILMIRKHGTPSSVVRSLNIAPADRNRVLAEARVRRKEAEFLASKRCARCWFSTTNGSCCCICSRLPALRFTTNTRFIIYQHNIELFNCGDDAKLLLCAAEDRTGLYVYGKEGDEERMVDEVFKNGGLER
jgi:hypothetical protein